MKTTRYFLTTILILALFTSCAKDYLDIVPDERPTNEDAFADPIAALGYLYSCYGYIPKQRSSFSLDLLTADEVVTAFEHENWAQFPRGTYTASNPVISYWDDLYKGIRQCYIFLENIDSVDGLYQDEVAMYKAEANFLIGYFHFLLLRMYGPIIIADHKFDVSMPASEYPVRATYDESVEFIAKKLDEAAAGLPTNRSSTEYGRATSVIAKAVKGRMLLYAASPLFNGGGEGGTSLYAGFLNAEGEQLISTTYDVTKWERAARANKEAIDAAHAAGFSLYYDATDMDSEFPRDPIQRRLRYIFIDQSSKEVIWAETRTEGIYDFQNKSTPYLGGRAWNGIAPTLETLENFYTENGLPIALDPEWDYNNRYEIDSIAIDSAGTMAPTLALNLNRGPRFEAWISYHNDYYEVMRNGKGRILTKYRRDDPMGIQGRSNNYSPTGYLNKKGVAPSLNQSTLSVTVQYPWPVIRLAELYLNYAEALIESGQQFNVAKEYIDKVRVRAGIPTIDEAWAPIGGASDKETLRKIVRQERTIELYLENHRFWDLRRWQIADEYLNERAKGLNIQGATNEEFFQISTVKFPRSFSQRNYLMPIPQEEINKSEQLIQNPGY